MINKICHVTSVHKPTDGRIFERECSSLSKVYDVTLIAPNVDDYEKNGVHVKGVALPKCRLKRQFCIRAVYKRMKEVDADVYHFHDPELIPLGVKIKRAGKIVIFDSHENVPVLILGKTYIPFFLRKLVSRAYEYYERKSFKKFDALVTVTPEIVERLKTINPNTYMLTNFPLYEDYSSKRTWGRKICFAGLISPIWMLENIIKSIEDIDVVFELAGPVPEDYLARLKSLAAWKKVNYRGVISHQDVQMLLAECSIGMAVSTDDNPNIGCKKGSIGVTKIFEYMMAGIPVIATNLISWVPIIEGNNCGLCVDCHDIESIKKSINTILNDMDAAKIMGDNGMRAIHDKFCWQKQEDTLLTLYSKLG